MEKRKILIKRQKSTTAQKVNSNNLEEWVAYWRANPHRFICDYLGLKFRDDFQPVLIYMMDRPLYFIFAASRGLAKINNVVSKFFKILLNGRPYRNIGGKWGKIGRNP